ncbi:MAG: glycosyltransferase family 4 protein [Mycobacteriales bacterium]
MRIAIVHPFTWVDVRRGGERYAHDLAAWLTSNGHEVDYLTGGPETAISHEPHARVVRLHHRHGERLTSWGVSKHESFGATVLPWLGRNRYDVVHALVPTAAVAARAARQRTVFTAIGHPTPETVGRKRQLLLLATRAAHVTTGLSESAAAGLRAVTGRNALVVNPGVRTDVFTPDLAPRVGAPRLLFAAHAGAPHKRLPDLVAAMPRILDAVPDARLTLGGGGDLGHPPPNRVQDAIDNVGTGPLEDVPQRFREATVTVLPSEHEAFGLVLVESLACGTPVVGADSGAIPEIVTPHAGVGALSRLGDVTDLADAVISTCAVAADPATPARCVEHAKKWSWDKVGPDHLAAYETALA